MQRIFNKIRHIIYNNSYLNRYMSDVKYRSTLSLYQGFFINMLYTCFNFLTSWIYASVWFGAVAVYYLFLSSIRFFLISNICKFSTLETNERSIAYELQTYRKCAYFMFLLNVAMTGVIIQMIWQNKGYIYPGYIIYVAAVYTFYCLITAIINIFKYRNIVNPILSAAKALSFAGALMSVLALQTAMLSQFSGDDAFRKVMNTATGSGVLVIVFMMAIVMVIRSNRKLNIITN